MAILYAPDQFEHDNVNQQSGKDKAARQRVFECRISRKSE
jgi:hypothetical protein